MALIKIMTPDNAEGEIKEVYDEFIKTAGMVPKPFQMYSASPPLFQLQKSVINYFMNHPHLKFTLLAAIRFSVASDNDFNYCMNLNTDFLKFAGLTEEQIGEVKNNPEKSALDEKDKAMLLFVLKVLKKPESIEKSDIDAMHELGWTDQDIFDAAIHGAGMLSLGKMFKAFKMDEDS
ncbi:carboxymuconolactone decarboxylase family protein [Thermodesulfobacteriota bacterium]